MPRRQTVEVLPARVRSEVDARLRASAFTGYVELSEWLRGKGHGISKSALQRYGAALQQRDQVGVGLQSLLTGIESDAAKDATALLMELGALKVREAALLARLEALGLAGWKQG